MKISVYKTIYDGSIGDGWKDLYAATKAYGEFWKKTIENDLIDSFPNYEINVDFDIVQNRLGMEKPEVSSNNYETEVGVRSRVEFLELSIWDNWFNSDEAIEYYED